MDNINYLIFIFVFVFVSSALLTWVVKHYALKNELLDIPNHRSSHNISTPTSGGVAVAIAFFLFTLYIYIDTTISPQIFLSIFTGSLIIAAIGFWDDHHELGRRWRISVHLFSAVWMFYWVGGLEPLPVVGGEVDLGMLGNVIGVFALVWLLNLYNFMDGIDGIATVEAITVAGFAALILYLNNEISYSIWLLALVFACLGFLVYNWPPAKIFMGDVGSGFLGFVLGGFALMTSNDTVLTVWTWLILLGVFLVDATITLIRRIVRGSKWYDPHRSHAYQHLAIKYGSHKKVTLGVLIVNVVWLFPLAWLSVEYPGLGIVFTLVAYLPLVVITLVAGAGIEKIPSAVDESV